MQALLGAGIGVGIACIFSIVGAAAPLLDTLYPWGREYWHNLRVCMMYLLPCCIPPAAVVGALHLPWALTLGGAIAAIVISGGIDEYRRRKTKDS